MEYKFTRSQARKLAKYYYLNVSIADIEIYENLSINEKSKEIIWISALQKRLENRNCHFKTLLKNEIDIYLNDQKKIENNNIFF